ncbi:MAG: type III-B CRISPR module RAMP protein Cmr6 [Rhodocyclaceae bacterium]|nr:type III-B CRISPR module RAMP protein Cmr6 [Rhodocyclaceae bacterium]
MTQLMRPALHQIANAAPQPHAGLLLARGLAVWDEESGRRSLNAGNLLATVCEIEPSALYKAAYERWKQTTADRSRFAHFVGRVEGRLFAGLAGGGALETGVTTQHSYGMPMLPGSSVKGAARALARAIGVTDAYRAGLFGEDDDSAKKAGRSGGAGCLVWHDAWWVPDGKPYVREVVTVHHQEYYGGRGEATDFDSPVPCAQIAVRGSFHFVVEGDPAWAELALSLLRQALKTTGIGAKRAAGYGYLPLPDPKAAAEEAEVEQAHRAAERARLEDQLGPRRMALRDFAAACEVKAAAGRRDRTNTGLHQQALALSREALLEGGPWSADERLALGEILEQWLPRVVETFDKKDDWRKARTKLQIATLKGQT